MKKIKMILLGTALMAVSALGITLAQANEAVARATVGSCYYNGCDVWVYEEATSWQMSITCDDGSGGNWNGSGTWEGCACAGAMCGA